jgi:hypothetical protein
MRFTIEDKTLTGRHSIKRLILGLQSLGLAQKDSLLLLK